MPLMPLMNRIRALILARRGAALIEFALALPLLLALLMGVLSYGSWFLTAHSLQQAANDAARAALAGVNAADRAAIANASIAESLARAGTLSPDRATAAIDDDGANLVVRISYDASDNPLLAAGLVPVPGTTIARDAAIRLDAP